MNTTLCKSVTVSLTPTPSWTLSPANSREEQFVGKNTNLEENKQKQKNVDEHGSGDSENSVNNCETHQTTTIHFTKGEEEPLGIV